MSFPNTFSSFMSLLHQKPIICGPVPVHSALRALFCISEHRTASLMLYALTSFHPSLTVNHYSFKRVRALGRTHLFPDYSMKLLAILYLPKFHFYLVPSFTPVRRIINKVIMPLFSPDPNIMKM